MSQSELVQPRRITWVQYCFVALVGVAALLHAVAGGIADFSNLTHNRNSVEPPFGVRFSSPVVASTLVSAHDAGLRAGDTVLRVNGRLFAGYIDLTEVAANLRPGDFFILQVRRSTGSSVEQLTIRAPAVGYPLKPVWAATLQIIFFVLPVLSMLTGLYVLLARPGSFHAWLVFVILGYTDAVFFPQMYMPHPLIPLGLVWSSIEQTLMPIALLLFGLYFPDRAPLDRDFAWIKWVLILPQIVSYPLDLLWSFAFMYHFDLVTFTGLHHAIDVIEQVSGMLSIFAFFALLFYRMRTTQGDARRRLRIVYWGAAAALTPLLILLIVSTMQGKQFGEDVPRSLFLISISMLLILPLSLAYVVVVQRAMELRILIRQGTKYFFARSTVRLALFLLAAWLTWAVVRLIQHPDEHRIWSGVWIAVLMSLFLVLRFGISRRIEVFIDRRFFREAYSTEQILAELSDQARSFTEVEPLLTTISERIASVLHIDRIAVFLRRGDTYALQYATATAVPFASNSLMRLPASWSTLSKLDLEREPTPVYKASASWMERATAAERTAMEELSAELLVPLSGRDRLLGLITLGPKRSEEPYSRTDKQLLQSVASQTGLALENAELLRHLTGEIAQRERLLGEIEIAREVQQRLFPQAYPDVPGIDVSGFCRPAQAVGGDYYDVFVTSDDDNEAEVRLAIAVGDISGKGISASLLMAS